MCLGAIYWARLGRIYYGNTKANAKAIGFDDSFIYEEIEKPIDKRKIPTKQLLPNEAIAAFNKWQNMVTKTEY
jgi:tRNA(Arg) A34 adenosine deaminase TadA